MNQLREQVNSERNVYATRDELKLEIVALEARLEKLIAKNYKYAERTEANKQWGISTIVAIGAIVISAIAIIVVVI
jgi:hypothetical protein